MVLRINKEKIKGIILDFFIMYSTDSALVTTNLDRIWARLSWILIICFFGYLLIKNIKNSGIKIKQAYPALIYVFSIFICMVVHNDGQYINYIQRVILILSCYFMAEDMPYKRFAGLFIIAMRAIAIVSIIAFLLRPLVLSSSFIPTIRISEMTYFKCLFFTNVSSGLSRNYGPFWEPGAYQLYLNWAIFYEMRNKESFNIKDILLWSVTVISTMSTSGILILAIEYCYFALSSSAGNNIRKRMSKYKFVLLGIGIIGIGVVFATSINQIAFDKIRNYIDNPESINSATVSTYTRVHSIEASLTMIKNNLWFGTGIGSSKTALDTFSITSNTNTILGIGATYGIFALIAYLIIIICSVRNGSSDRLTKVFHFLIVALMYSTESLMVSFFFTLILLYEGKKEENTITNEMGLSN